MHVPQRAGQDRNCQIGASVHAVTDWASAAIDWRLFRPEARDEEKATDEQTATGIRVRRARCAIPNGIRHRAKWRLELDILDDVTGEWDLPWRPVVADVGYGDAAEFRLGVTGRVLTYVLTVSPHCDRIVIRLAREELDYPVSELSLTRSDLLGADEVFLAGTLDEIRSVSSIDGIALPAVPGPVTTRLRSAYCGVCEGSSGLLDESWVHLVSQAAAGPARP